MPPIRFDRWPETQRFVKSMSNWRKPTDVSVKDYHEGLDSMHEETKNAFPYAYYLAHAALFAARGNWRIGAILAIRALVKVEDRKIAEGSTGNGREASYLAAYCLRHGARSDWDKDLAEARAYLEQARTIHADELHENPALVALPERFEAEELAFETMKPMRRRYPTVRDASAGSIEQPLQASHEELAALRSRYEVLRTRVKEINTTSPTERDDTGFADVVHCLLSRINANICMLSILMDDFANESFLESGRELNEFLGGGDDRKSFYLLTLQLFWFAASGRRSVKRSEIKKHLDDNRIKKHSVFPYDENRYQEIREKLQNVVRR